MIHACVGVEVVPQGPLEGDHMASSRVGMAVREVNRQCRSVRSSAERNTCVRIADDSPLLSWQFNYQKLKSHGEEEYRSETSITKL